MRGLLVDVVALLILGLLSPIWVVQWARTGKLRTDWAGRFGAACVPPDANGATRILLHAVSVGEVNAIRALVTALDGQGAQVIVATTTDTGFARASTLYGAAHTVVRYPYDFSFAVRRFLDRVRPNVVGLVELEVWPAMTSACAQRGIPVAVVNGRLSPRSLRWYLRLRLLVSPSFRRLAAVAAQSDAYAERFRALGTPSDRVSVTGTMKWDATEITDSADGAEALSLELGIDRERPLVVAGSTAPEEHQLLREAIMECGGEVQLVCAPRRPEWFDRAAQEFPGVTRRSDGVPAGDGAKWFLLDTIGELRAAYGLADVVVIGRSFGARYGSDMTEPVGLGKAVVVGPAVSDFEDTVAALRAGRGIVQTTRAELGGVIRGLLADPAARRDLAARGRDVIRAKQGATRRNARVLLALAREGTGASVKPREGLRS